ncbi:MAG: hypothetical protein U1C72_01205 [Candidatus Pacearchaeota archaeon]|nr:hypothetical protein [Candidatus Pacearchaeota archaeon]
MTRRILWAAVISVTVLVGLLPVRQAGADINGSFPLPAKGGLAILVYTSGGSVDQLRGEVFDKGCGLTSIWTTKEGRFVGYAVGAPSFVNTEFLQIYPEGQIPAGSPLVVVCQEGGVGGPIQYECGGATFIVERWEYMPSQLTDVSPVPQPEIYLRYRIPVDATNVLMTVNIETSVGDIPPGTIQKVVPGYGQGANAPLGTNISAGTIPGLGDRFGIADGQWHSSTGYVDVPTEDFYDRGGWDRTLPEGWRYSDYSPRPFELVLPPSLLGGFERDGFLWVLNTSSTDYCVRTLPR